MSLTAIADALGKSENYLSNFYKDQTGERLSGAIQKKRFERAAHLLGLDEMSVDKNAYECGYANSGSFRRAFKRYYGMSPSEYRESIAAGANRGALN